jgi:hypothetical protein
MTAIELTLRCVDHALAELAERAEQMPLADLQGELEDLLAGGRSATGDLIAAVLSREIARRDAEDRDD